MSLSDRGKVVCSLLFLIFWLNSRNENGMWNFGWRNWAWNLFLFTFLIGFVSHQFNGVFYLLSQIVDVVNALANWRQQWFDFLAFPWVDLSSEVVHLFFQIMHLTSTHTFKSQKLIETLRHGRMRVEIFGCYGVLEFLFPGFGFKLQIGMVFLLSFDLFEFLGLVSQKIVVSKVGGIFASTNLMEAIHVELN